MSDWLPDTPVVTRPVCPGCEPEADFERSLLEVRWCDSHSPGRDGTADEIVRSAGYLSGSAEAGGDDNKRICDLLHRGIEPNRPG